MKTVFITGISRGIGKALAQNFLKEGYFVIGTSLTGKIDFYNENIICLKLDLSLKTDVELCAKEIETLNKDIEIVINNAGICIDDEDTSVDIGKLRKTLDVNLIGPIDLTERIIPLLKKGSHIINISSSAGSLERVGHVGSHYPNHYPCYKISKTAINMYTRTLALLYKDDFIVSSVHPGWVKTDMGGDEATMMPDEAAKYIYELAISKPETGQFWFKDKKFPW